MAALLILVLLAAGAADPETHFRRGQEALRSGDAGGAVREFKAVLAADPTIFEAQVNLGLAYHLAGDYTRAVEVLSAARRTNPALGGADLVLGSDALKLGKVDQAIPSLEAVTSANTGNRQAHRLLCEAYTARDDFRRAWNCIQSVYGPEPADAEGWYFLGKSSLDLAKAATLRMRRRFPESAWTRRLEGDSFAERGDWKHAAQSYQQSVDAAPWTPEFHALLGFALLRSAHPQEARRAFQRELEIAPNSRNGACGLAETQGGPKCEITAREKTDVPDDAIPGQPGPEISYKLVQSYLSYADASFDMLLTRYRDSWLAHRLRAEYDELRENPAGAVSEFRAAIAKHPDDADLHASLAGVLYEQGSAAKAETEIRSALKISPDSAPFQVLAARIAARQDRVPEAIDLLHTALRHDPASLQAHALLGEMLWRQGDAQGAVAELTKAAPIDAFGNLHYLLFQAYRKLGDAEKAKAALARSVDLRKNRLQADARKVDTAH
ncbi:MAG: tetratricopeptide repeat protein [Bryobacteraceae bacterium]